MAECLSPEDLDRLGRGSLDPAERNPLHAHVKGCARCQEALEQHRKNQAYLAEVASDLNAAAQTTPTALSGPPTEAPEDEGGPAFEGYETVRELHRGGQGVVYQAIQTSTKRKVAIKVLLAGPLATPRARRRFEREIELVASLKHPNIISIFHSGQTSDGRQFFVMDYVRGVPLHRYVRQTALSLEEALRVFATVCQAVTYAHQKGVIHRDLKPSNILVNTEGVPKVLDFGLAKMVGGPDETLVSTTGQIIGTLPYMSPEQARGNPDEIDIRTDVYALGVILYELLTGQYPYPVVGQMVDVLRHITETAPSPPSRRWKSGSGVTQRSQKRLRPGQCPIDDEIQTVVLKALSKNRERRYQSAGELARDIDHYLADEPIEARRDSLWYVLQKTIARHRAACLMTLGVIFVVLASATVVWTLYGRTRRAELSSQLYEATLYLHEGNYTKAARLAAATLQNDPHNVEARLIHIRAQRDGGHDDQAYKDLLALSAERPDEAAVFIALAEITARSDPGLSKSYAEQARKRQKLDSTQDYYLRALVSPDDGEAMELLNEVLRRDPAHFGAIMARKERAYRLKDFSRMRTDAERALSLRPNDALAWWTLGTALHRQKLYAEAVPALERATALRPDLVPAWFNLGLALRGTGDIDRALSAFQEVTRLDPTHKKASYRLGHLLFERGAPEKAKPALERAVRITPQAFGPNYYLGLCLESLGELPQALTAFNTCLTLSDLLKGTVLVSVGRVLDRLGRPNEALKAYEQALEHAEKNKRDEVRISALNNMAWIYLTAQPATVRDYDRAAILARQAYEATAPDDVYALETLALAELRVRNYEAARRSSMQGLEADAGSRWSIMIRAWAELELGNRRVATDLRARFSKMAADQDPPDLALDELVDQFDKRVAATYGGRRP